MEGDSKWEDWYRTIGRIIFGLHCVGIVLFEKLHCLLKGQWLDYIIEECVKMWNIVNENNITGCITMSCDCVTEKITMSCQIS